MKENSDETSKIETVLAKSAQMFDLLKMVQQLLYSLLTNNPIKCDIFDVWREYFSTMVCKTIWTIFTYLPNTKSLTSLAGCIHLLAYLQYLNRKFYSNPIGKFSKFLEQKRFCQIQSFPLLSQKSSHPLNSMSQYLNSPAFNPTKKTKGFAKGGGWEEVVTEVHSIVAVSHTYTYLYMSPVICIHFCGLHTTFRSHDYCSTFYLSLSNEIFLYEFLSSFFCRVWTNFF